MLYKSLIQLKARFKSPKGELTLEQLFDLSLTDLNAIAVSLDEEYKNSGGKSFLAVKSKKDKLLKSKLQVVVDIIQTKEAEIEKSRNSSAKRAHNAKIDALIAQKQEEELSSLSVEELEKLYK